MQRPDRYAFFRQTQAPGRVIARGAGLSFSAASFGPDATTIDMRQFDRILDFDSGTGEVYVEAGITLGTLFYFLEARGFCLAIQPGYPGISVGGCIGGDVHGKNAARDGTFLAQVKALRLFHPTHGVVDISPTEQPELFRATCGGFGLTGIILTARLGAKRLVGHAVTATLHRVPDLPAAAKLLAQLLPAHDFAFGWHDINVPNARFGHGVITASRIVDVPARHAEAFTDKGMTAANRQRFPLALLNRSTSRAMNIAYGLVLSQKTSRPLDLFSAMFPFYGKETYFALFGKAGFHESQVIVPPARFPEYCQGVREAVARTKAIVCFAALKLFAGTNDLIRFDATGVSLALHLPRTEASARFLDEIDRLTLAVGGLPNALKDSRLPRAVFEATYPEADRFRAFIRQWDPKRLFRSGLTDRLGL